MENNAKFEELVVKLNNLERTISISTIDCVWENGTSRADYTNLWEARAEELADMIRDGLAFRRWKRLVEVDVRTRTS